MLRRNYGSIKADLARVCGSTGMNVADPRLMSYTNRAIEELISEGDWPTIIDRLKFSITNCTFVLPSDYDRMLYCTVNDIPQQMQSPWYEFVGYGLELLNTVSTPNENSFLDSRLSGVLDKDAVATFRDIPSDGVTRYPRVYGRVDERVAGVRPNIIIQGYDVDGNWITSDDGAGGRRDGVAVEINGDTAPYWIQSTQSFSYVTAISKPITKGNVLLYAATNDGATQDYVGQYAPYDETPFYRQYSIPSLRTNSTQPRCVLARCRRRFVKITRDADWLLISNLPALENMLQAVYYGQSGDPDNYVKYKLLAIDLLKKESKAYIGLQMQKPLFTVSEAPNVRADGIYIL